MSAHAAHPSLQSHSGPGDPAHRLDRGFDHRVFLTYNALAMAVAIVVVVTNWSEPAALALGAIMFAMSGFLLLMCRIERLAHGAMAFLNRQMRVASTLMVAVACLAAGCLVGPSVSDGWGGLGGDALAASGERSVTPEDQPFWEERIFQAMTTGDRTLFAHACGALATLESRPGICSSAGAASD